jgi:uncharacterized protein YndB with AHSA1/START domain/DNA-binding transcriptional ArsR family regulator
VDDVFRALADPSRRLLLDKLFERDGQTLSELEAHLAATMTRFGVMKHLKVLEEASLVTTRKVGREKFHYLNPVPIQLLTDRWINRFVAPAALALADLKHTLEAPVGATMTDTDRTNDSTPPAYVCETYIRATPDQVWQAIVDPAFTRQYYFGTAVDSTFAPGASHTYRYDNGDVAAHGEILEAEPGKRLVLTFNAVWDDTVKADAPHRMTWELEPIGDVCRVRVTHDGFERATASYEQVQGGMPIILSSLKSLLETGAAIRLG